MQAIDRARRWLGGLLVPELRSLPPKDDDWWWTPVDAGQSTYSGKFVNARTALGFTAVYAANLVLAESMGQLPAGIFRTTESGSEPDKNHPLWGLLHDAPNDEITAIDFRGAMQGSLGLWGNAYARIVRDGPGGPARELWPMDPAFVEIDRSPVDRRSYRYKYTEPGTAREYILYPLDVLHLRGFTPPDSIEGYSPIRLAREAVGSGLAAEEFGGRFFGQGTNLGGVIKFPGNLGPDGAENLRASLEKFYAGLKNSHSNLILEEGGEYTRLGMPLADAQFIEFRKFSVNEVARIYRVPLHMLGDLERSTNNNIEHQGLEFVVHTLMPWIVRWEQGIKQRLLSTREQRKYQIKFNVNAFMRGDAESRAKYYLAARTGGWMDKNEIRALEDMNSRPEGGSLNDPLNSNAAPSGDKPNDNTGTPVSKD